MHVDLFGGHPVDVELGEVDGVVNLKQVRALFSLGIFARKKVSFYASRVEMFKKKVSLYRYVITFMCFVSVLHLLL